ncbi:MULTISPECIES: hypothetical protein [Corynebacterium]|uniref:hypothetical protein n=1 Tax=Corynebacterium TaxID=1716 RepID=UPI0008A3481E|nr:MULTISPECIES: hypothetical protein [Corynebacterium]MCA0444145.1 hypothetical protein [Corynebacterium amycolatum]MCT1548788.1 hypothetical protein [Corynebacterium amycolatum]MDK7315954.1 hypothetical protein [Corynebacterium amycolatum]MDK8727897.1 hypothetical protein [Corynebacterium amycolatum]OFM18809.1 hypothetical protein HMPREF2714_01640 [Corynebacterium sp. HMSC077G01]
MNAPQIQTLSEAAILAATDELVATVPELADATLARPWTISAIVAASSGVIAGHRSFPAISAAAQAVAYATFHVKPLSFGNTALGALLAHILLTTNGEELSFAETWDLVKGGT